MKSVLRVISLTLLFGLSACTSVPLSRSNDPLARGQTPVATPIPGPTAPPPVTAAGVGDEATPQTTPSPEDTVQRVEPGYPGDLAGYAREAVAAWAAGDRSRLDELEEAGGVLHRAAATSGFSLARCESSSCLFLNGRGDELRLPLRSAAVGGPRAVGAAGTLQPTTYPSDNRAYAEAALGAWQGRNDARLRMLTKQQLSCATVDAFGPARTNRWTFDHGEGGVGSVYLTWRDQTAHGLTFRFDNGPAAPSTGAPAQHRITEIIYEP